VARGDPVHRAAGLRPSRRRRDRALAAAGFLVLRYMWADVVNRPREVAREIRAALARRRLRAA
jgi:very-short-patch-repair endonuclease